LHQRDDDTADLYYEHERLGLDDDKPRRIILNRERVSTLEEVVDSWKKLFEYIKALTNFTEKEEQLDDALVSNPTKELKDLIKKFNTYYETFVKGKKGNDGKDIPKGDSELGEPDLGGFIYCKWQLERYFFCDIFDLVQ
jgi:hypothetical protein